jgi:hypothetical protein
LYGNVVQAGGAAEVGLQLGQKGSGSLGCGWHGGVPSLLYGVGFTGKQST